MHEISSILSNQIGTKIFSWKLSMLKKLHCILMEQNVTMMTWNKQMEMLLLFTLTIFFILIMFEYQCVVQINTQVINTQTFCFGFITVKK